MLVVLEVLVVEYFDVLSISVREFFVEVTYPSWLHGRTSHRSAHQKTHDAKNSKHQEIINIIKTCKFRGDRSAWSSSTLSSFISTDFFPGPSLYLYQSYQQDERCRQPVPEDDWKPLAAMDRSRNHFQLSSLSPF